jgi:cbb3-type cytochrome oxidase subunit 3
MIIIIIVIIVVYFVLTKTQKKICEKEAQEAVLLNDPERRAVLREAEERVRVHEQTRLDHYAKIGAIYVKRAASASLLPVSRKVWDTKDPAAIAASIKKRRPRKRPSVDVKTDVKRMLRLTTKLMSRLTPLVATPNKLEHQSAKGTAVLAIPEEESIIKDTRASK